MHAHAYAGKSKPGAQERLALLQQGKLPASYGIGLRATTWLGRSTVSHKNWCFCCKKFTLL